MTTFTELLKKNNNNNRHNLCGLIFACETLCNYSNFSHHRRLRIKGVGGRGEFQFDRSSRSSRAPYVHAHTHIHAIFVHTPAIDSKNLESYDRHAERRTTTRRTGSVCQLQKQNIEEGRSTTTAVRFLTRSRLTCTRSKVPSDWHVSLWVQRVYREVQNTSLSLSLSFSLAPEKIGSSRLRCSLNVARSLRTTAARRRDLWSKSCACYMSVTRKQPRTLSRQVLSPGDHKCSVESPRDSCSRRWSAIGNESWCSWSHERSLRQKGHAYSKFVARFLGTLPERRIGSFLIPCFYQRFFFFLQFHARRKSHSNDTQVTIVIGRFQVSGRNTKFYSRSWDPFSELRNATLYTIHVKTVRSNLIWKRSTKIGIPYNVSLHNIGAKSSCYFLSSKVS